MSMTIYSKKAPEPIGTYSQARCANGFVFMSAQAPISPETGKVETGDFEIQLRQCFTNLEAIANEAGGTLDDVLKVTVYIIDFEKFSLVNTCMADFFTTPYPARAVLGVSNVPANASCAVEAVMTLEK